MSRNATRPVLWLAVATLCLWAAPAETQTGNQAGPRLQPVAETRLLMEGLNQANFRGLERSLQQRPADVDAWTFARGQALLIAETGNLLMLRPPRNQGEKAWLERSAELRTVATRLARAASEQDYPASRTGLTALANSCNRCHQAFRVRTRVTPFADARRDGP